VIAVGLVLSAVFVPCTFIGGIVGLFFRQFAVTIAVSTVISAFNSLTLSPALAALLLRPKGAAGMDPLPPPAFALVGAWLGFEFLRPWLAAGLERSAAPPWLAPVLAATLGAVAVWLIAQPLNRVLAWFFATFNRGFNQTTDLYTRAVGRLLRASAVTLLVY